VKYSAACPEGRLENILLFAKKYIFLYPLWTAISSFAKPMLTYETVIFTVYACSLVCMFPACIHVVVRKVYGDSF
jgi:hypothetical protein